MNHNAWQYMLLSSYTKLSRHSRSLSFMEILPALLYRGGPQGPTRDREICFNCAQSLESCPTLCDSMDHGPPGSSVHGILQARILEWVAISFSSDKVWSEWSEVTQLCRLSATPWTVTWTIMPRPQEGIPGSSVVENLPANSGDLGLIPGLRRSPGEGHGNPLQNSYLGNPMDRGAWWATV